MRQKIKNDVYISVDDVDLTTLRNIEFYVKQLSVFFQYIPVVVNANTMIVTIPKEDADRLAVGSVKLQFAFTDAGGKDDASDVLEIDVAELLKAEGYNAD